MVFASCSNDDDPNPNDDNKEYLFAAKCVVAAVEEDETGEIQKMQQELVNKALAKVGFTGEAEYPLTISGKDSVSVRKVLLEKIAPVEQAINDAPIEIHAELRVTGAEKSIITSEDKPGRIISTWYEKKFGTPSNPIKY